MDADQQERLVGGLKEAARMCAYAYDKTLMLLVAFVLGSSYSYLSKFK